VSRYVRRTYHYDEHGFETDDEIIEILHHSPQKSRITALVLQDQDVPTTFEKGAGESLPKTTYFCNADTATGQCTREVDGPDDTCWQHSDEDK